MNGVSQLLSLPIQAYVDSSDNNSGNSMNDTSGIGNNATGITNLTSDNSTTVDNSTVDPNARRLQGSTLGSSSLFGIGQLI